jgi:hypothetical protein
MKKWVIEVNGVGYKCLDDTDKVTEALRINNSSDKDVSFLAFRNSVEVNGERYILRRITLFKKCNASIISIPNNVDSIGERCLRLS